MKIVGFQKLTLLDYPEKTACTVFTPGCNFRCPFCHNAGLVLSPREESVQTETAFFAFLCKRQGLLDGVCITGGEPLLQPDLQSFCENIHRLGFLVKLDTNGSFPGKLREIIESGAVDYVAMDLKNSPGKYPNTTGCTPDMNAIRESVDILKNAPIFSEFRTTLVREFHTAEDIRAIAQWLQGAKRYYLQTFRDSGELISPGLSPVSPAQTEEYRKIASEYIPEVRIRGGE